jgi:acyl carrier protein
LTFIVVTVKTGDMGLDAVEIVMAVEDAFDIRIEDAEAEKLLTPRQLIDCVQGKVSGATSNTCLTQRAFNLLRKSLLRHGDWKRRDIAPGVALATLMPKQKRRALLEQITVELGIKKPPEFVRARWLNILLLVGSLLAGLLAAIATGHLLQSVAIWIFIGVAIGTAGIALRLTKPLCQEFPANLKTLGDLARWVMTHKSDLADATPTGWTREQITARVREIIVEQLGVKPGFSEDANFVKDLGLS